MAEKTNVPEIRFTGFTDPWEQRKLGELLLFQNGFNGSGESFGSGIPLISVMDVLDDGFITHETVRGKARLSDEEASRYCVEYGDVLFQRSSENQEDAGTSNVYLDQHVSSAFGGFVIRGKKVGEYNPFFIKYLLGSSSIRKQITHRAQGAQHINVSQDTLNDVALLMPSMREQEAVGSVLLHLDNLITLHQRKYDKLAQLKKSMLDKMFPKPGERFPEIRFAGFTDPWEQRKLGDVVRSLDTGRSVNSVDQAPGPNDVAILKTSCVSYDSFDSTERKKVVSEETDLVRCPVEAGTIIVSRMNTPERVGACGYVPASYANLYLPDRLWKLSISKDCDAFLLYELLASEPYKAQIKGMASGTSGSMHNVPQGPFMDLILSLPRSIDEQCLISSCFSRLDNLITLHQRKLELLRNTKKSLLDRMFV